VPRKSTARGTPKQGIFVAWQGAIPASKDSFHRIECIGVMSAGGEHQTCGWNSSLYFFAASIPKLFHTSGTEKDKTPAVSEIDLWA
jgi:hypothetical protein